MKNKKLRKILTIIIKKIVIKKRNYEGKEIEERNKYEYNNER